MSPNEWRAVRKGLLLKMSDEREFEAHLARVSGAIGAGAFKKIPSTKKIYDADKLRKQLNKSTASQQIHTSRFEKAVAALKKYKFK